MKRAILYLVALLIAFPLDASAAQIKSIDLFAKDAPKVAAEAPKEAPKAEEAPKVGEVKKPGAIFCIAVRMELRDHYRSQGMGRIAALRKSHEADDEAIALLLPDAEKIASAKMGAQVKVGALGDGKIIEAIIAFFKSPQGQAILDALVKLLLGLLLIQHQDNPAVVLALVDYLVLTSEINYGRRC